MRQSWVVAAAVLWLGGAASGQDQVVLTGVVRDFAELVPKKPGGHPDFNPTEHPGGWEAYGCFDRMDAGRGAVEPALGSNPPNPDGVAGLIAFDRDDRGPVLKPAYATPPNCFRSRFADWYSTRNPDVNRAFFLDLPFAKSGSNYVYDNSEFFPLDDPKKAALKPQVPGVTETFGHRQSGTQDGIDLASHNYGFTFEFHARFTYRKGTGQRFSFRGDDDVWVYINDGLVIDLGGLHAAENADVDLDALPGLEDGKAYPLDFYFAERRYSASRLTITTSLELRPVDKPDPPKPDPAGPVIARAVKAVEDTALTAAPVSVVLVTFTEAVKVDAAGVLVFRDPQGREQRVDMRDAVPVDAKDGTAVTWKFTLAPASPNDPAVGWQVRVGQAELVSNAKGVKVPAQNPWRTLESGLPKIHIGPIRAEKDVTLQTLPADLKIRDPFVLLTSDKVTPDSKDYVPLHPEKADDWIFKGDGRNPGAVVFGFELSHPAAIELSIFDTQGRFVNKSSVTVSRDDLLVSGKFSRVSPSRAFLVRFAWYPVAADGGFVATGAYILKARFKYGLDARDHVAKGTRDRLVTFGFLRPAAIRGLD